MKHQFLTSKDPRWPPVVTRRAEITSAGRNAATIGSFTGETLRSAFVVRSRSIQLLMMGGWKREKQKALFKAANRRIVGRCGSKNNCRLELPRVCVQRKADKTRGRSNISHLRGKCYCYGAQSFTLEAAVQFLRKIHFPRVLLYFICQML